MAGNNYYQLYIEQTYRLVETLMIKFDQIADAYNTKVMITHGSESVDLLDKTSWKYYQNMSGSYHFSDAEMLITSLDTLETIKFSKENLALHRATRNAYQYDSRYYRELVSRYPDQELLILAILYSEQNIEDIINVKDGTIIFYLKELVEVNEYSLMEELQDWIYKYLDRWVIYSYSLSDDLYTTLYIGQLYIQLVPNIVNLRLKRCKTNEVHSYHVREYLASKNGLDRYIDVMTKEQTLFFYRNILYIQRNAGKRDTFDWLIENVMTKRDLPVYEYTMKHKVDEMLPSEYAPDRLNYEPVPLLKRKTVNFLNVDAEEFTYTLKQALSKVKPLAPLNETYHEYAETEIHNKLIDSESNVIYTKLLESVVNDYQNAVPYTLESILMNHWVLWSKENIYTAKVNIDFNNNRYSVTMSAFEAFLIFLYCINRAFNISLNEIPDVLVQRVLRLTPTTKQEIRNITEPEFYKDSEIDILLSTRPTIDNVISIQSFFDKGTEVYFSTLKQHKLLGLSELDHNASNIEVATMALYEDRKVLLNEQYSTFDELLLKYSIDFSDYTNLMFYELSIKIFEDVTGYRQYSQYSIKKIQRAMIDIFTQLSSYSIAFISDVNNPPITLIKTRETKPLKITNKTIDHDYVEEPLFIALNDNTQTNSYVSHDESKISSQECKTFVKDSFYYETYFNIKYKDNPIIAPIEVFEPIWTVLNGVGYEQQVSTLTDEQKKELFIFN